MKGRKPHPTDVRFLRQNTRNLNPFEPKYGELEAEPPEELKGPEARAEWQRIIGILSKGHVTAVDRALLMAYCAMYGEWLKLQTAIRREGFTIHNSKGVVTPNPKVAMGARALVYMMRAAEALGFSPSSRGRIVAIPPASEASAPPDDFTADQRKRRAG